jgi:hypothetical protein
MKIRECMNAMRRTGVRSGDCIDSGATTCGIARNCLVNEVLGHVNFKP